MTSSSDEKPPRRIAGVELIQDVSAISTPIDGFLRRHRHRVKTSFSDGTRGEVYVVDYVDRAHDRREAAIVAAYAAPTNAKKPDTALLLLRQQLRYPVYLVEGRPLYLEIVAGVLELPESVASCVVRELREEAGIEIDASMVETLGPSFYPMASAVTERLHPACVKLPRETLIAAAEREPPGDGSPFEEGAELVLIGLGEAIALIDGKSDRFDLRLDDAKTEILLRRLWAKLSGRPL